MKSTLLTLAALLAGFALLQMSNALQGTLLVVRAGLEGFSATEIGLISSGFSFGMCLGAFQASRLISRVGHIRVFAALASMASAAALIHLVFIHPMAWIIVRTLTGFCFAGLFVVVESWLNASAGRGNRGQILSIYAMCGMAAGVAGQLLFLLADPANFQLFVIVSIVMSIALVPIALSQASAPVSQGTQESPSIKRLWEFSPFGAVAMLLTGVAMGAFFGLAPLFAQRMGFAQGDIALLMAALPLGGLVLQYPLGWLSDRVNRRVVSIVLALGTLALCGLVVGAPVPTLLPSLIVAFLMGGLLLPAHSILIAHVNDRAPPEAMLAVSSALVLVYGIGATIGPALGGQMMERLGPQGMLYLVGSAQALIAAYGLYRLLVVEGPRSDEKVDFMPAPVDRVAAELEATALEEAAS